jgi:hypothetical protein
MREKTDSQESETVSSASSPLGVLRQIMDLLGQVLPMHFDIASDFASFQSKPGGKTPLSGILSVFGKITREKIIQIQIELLKTGHKSLVDLEAVMNHLATLGDKTHLLPPEKDKKTGLSSYRVELNVQPAPMNLTRSSLFIEEIEKLNRLAKSLQETLPDTVMNQDLNEAYAEFSDILKPILPWDVRQGTLSSEFKKWCRRTADLLKGALPVALQADYASTASFALACLAELFHQSGGSLGKIVLPMVNAKGLIEVAQKAPGVIVLEAASISLGTNPYEIGNEIQNVLSRLAAMGKSAVFTGSHTELQNVFHGGQGGVVSPFFPVVCGVPPVPVHLLIHFTIHRMAENFGGISTAKGNLIADRLKKGMSALSDGEKQRVLPFAVSRELHAWFRENQAETVKPEAFVHQLNGLTETLSGLSHRPRVKRVPHVQRLYTDVLTDPSLLDYLCDHLLAQRGALLQLCDRLSMECLTRPDHQPICYCAQGTPATGKSQSAILIAQRLGIPHINIDAASIPDFYTASAQLLGSGRGIVNSYQSGRLEQAAKHHSGVLVEISDLDHASPRVRSALADLFLQVLETGEAQSAAGAMFGCANIIFAFTINLPDRLDEKIRSHIGFGDGPSEREIRKDVESAIKDMFSSAFLSRIGTPIMFEPLNGDQLAEIIERAIRSSVMTAAGRLHMNVDGIRLQENLGRTVLDCMKANVLSHGARILLEHARNMTARAMVRYNRERPGRRKETLCIASPTGLELEIKPSA